jgi:hypothetical protein
VAALKVIALAVAVNPKVVVTEQLALDKLLIYAS